MHYVVVWSIKPEQFEAVIERFATADPAPEAGTKLLGRWHEMGTGKGFSLIESDDPVSLSKYQLAWADLVDLKIVPVVGDEEIARALGAGGE